jgi:hypothetical protein
MTVMKEKLTEAINAHNNDLKSFVWKFARKSDGTQPEIKLVDATPEQLQTFYTHCKSMLYSNDKNNPGRYVLLDLIREQREKCNIELFMRKMELGSISADGKGYPKFMYWQNILDFKKRNAEYFAEHSFEESPISIFTGKLPREFENISIGSVMDACLDQLGLFNNKHITFSFILNMGVYLTPDEMKEFNEKDSEGNRRSKLELIKERLNIKSSVKLTVKPGGLNFNELRAMVNLRTKKYSELTTEQLIVLRNKVLFRLENEVMFHATQWEKKIIEITKVADSRGITLKEEL